MEDYTNELMRALQLLNINKAKGLMQHCQYSKDHLYNLNLEEIVTYIDKQANLHKKSEKEYRLSFAVDLNTWAEEITTLKDFKTFVTKAMEDGAIPVEETAEVQAMGGFAADADTSGDA